MFGPLDPQDPTIPNPNLANWQEHQRRQRTLRMLMMFLMILLLMDGDEPIERRHNANKQHSLRSDKDREGMKYGYFGMFVDKNGDLINPLSWEVWRSRREEDGLLYDAVGSGERYERLVGMNDGKDLDKLLNQWAERKVMIETKVALGLNSEPDRGSRLEEDVGRANSVSSDESLDIDLPDYADDTQLFHYPRNSTGYYRGIWVQIVNNSSKQKKIEMDKLDSTQDIPLWVQQQLQKQERDAGLIILPPDKLSESMWTFNNSKGNSTGGRQASFGSRNTTSSLPALSLTKNTGRAAFQLYSRPVPAMKELSIVDGLVKLYDGMTTSFVSRRTDILLRVQGVLVHSSGKISLVSSSIANGEAPNGKKHSVLGIKKVVRAKNDKEMSNIHASGNEVSFRQVEEENVDEITDRRRHRRLQDLLHEFLSQPKKMETQQPQREFRGLFHNTNELLSQIRDDVLEVYSSQYAHEILSMKSMQSAGWSVLQSVDDDEESLRLGARNQEDLWHKTRVLQSVQSSVMDDSGGKETAGKSNSAGVAFDTGDLVVESDKLQTNASNYIHNGLVSRRIASTQEQALQLAQSSNNTANKRLNESQYTYPFPFVCDDANDSIKKSSSPASRKLPPREMVLEANAAGCEFQMNIDVHEEQWAFGEWRNVVLQRFRIIQAFNPYLSSKFDRETERLKRSQILMLKSQVNIGLTEDSFKEPLVMTMSGTIESSNCNFSSFVNVTAIRTNWEHTTAKAINYSFYMMLTCLIQIVVLLRQLLHTQAQSAASNVSLFCVGWQTVLDAILCIAHIFLCLVMQPLFTAFASVAFFKLLIFCVVEMKYMALILQSRNNANNPNRTQDDLRRQITLLHLRFYAALMVAIMSFWYIGQTHKTLYVLLLYSFWVPQIILNTITEARKPMHPYYIFGMSFTRLIAPIYVFAVRKNFLKEVNPDFPSDPQMCQILVVWVLLQTAILVGQMKYGTRFMIPQRFLPPKFDYHRSIPPSLLLPPSPSPTPTNGSSASEIELGPLLNGESSPQGARNRRARLGSRVDESSNRITTMSTDISNAHTLDCVICYNEIDVNDRSGYMLAPCLHIFHSACLEQWMEVKMECPICRCNLPAI